MARTPMGSMLSLIPSILLSSFQLLGIASHGIINLPGAFIGQNVIESRLDSLERPRCHLCRRHLWPAPFRSHLSIDETRVDTDYLSSLVAKFDSGSVRDRKGRVLRGCISSVEGGCEPTHHRKHIDNRAASVLSENRSKRLNHGGHSKYIHFHLFAHGIHSVRSKKWRIQHRSCIVDEQGDVGALPHRSIDLTP